MICAAPAAQAQMQESVEKFRSGGVSVTIECFAPSTERKLPAILLLHGGGGLGDATGDIFREIGRSLASQGFVVLVPHYFERTKHVDRPEFVRGNDGDDRRHQGCDRLRGFESRIVDPTRIGLVGYSMGSYIAFFRAARDERIKAVASCSGSLPVESKSKFPPVLILQGSKDRSSPLARIKAIRRGAQSQGHSFRESCLSRLGSQFRRRHVG